jgi:hypothetical protein
MLIDWLKLSTKTTLNSVSGLRNTLISIGVESHMMLKPRDHRVLLGRCIISLVEIKSLPHQEGKRFLLGHLQELFQEVLHKEEPMLEVQVILAHRQPQEQEGLTKQMELLQK